MRSLKLTWLVLVLAIALQCCNIFSVYGEENKKDITKQYTILRGLNIIRELKEENLQDEITTDVLAQCAAKLKGTSDTSISEYYLRLMNIDKREKVDIETLSKVLVNITGVDYFLNDKTTYTSLARKNGIYKNIDMSDLDYVTYEVLVLSLFNTGKAKLVEPVSFVSGNITYETNPKETVFTKYHRLYDDTGIVTGNAQTRLNDSNTTFFNNVQINDYVFDKGSTNADELLGYSVNYYYKVDEDADKNELVYIKETTNNDELIVKSEDYIRFKKNTLSYRDEKGTVRNANLMTGVSVAKNGFALITCSEKDFMISEGTIKLIDNNADRKYDVIIISSTYDIYVGDIAQGKIYDKYSDKTLDLSESIEGLTYTVKKADGTAGSIDDIQKNMLISVAYSVSSDSLTTKCVIYIANEINKKVLTEVKKDEICLDESVYPKSSLYKTSEAKINVKVGSYVKGFVNFEGRVFVEYDLLNGNTYGYFVGVSKESDMDALVRVKIFDEYGNMNYLDCAKSVEVDCISYKNREKLYDTFFQNKTLRNGLVLFSKDKDGKLKSIDFACDMKDEYAVKNDGNLYLQEYGKYTYFGGGKEFNHLIPVMPKTKVFSIPDDNSASDKLYSINDRNSIVDLSAYNVYSYTLSADTYEPTALVTLISEKVAGSTELNAEKQLYYVNKISNAYFDDENCYKLNLYDVPRFAHNSAEFVDFYVEADSSAQSVVPTLNKGDVIRLLKTGGKVTALEKVFDVITKKILISGEVSDAYTSIRYFKGYVNKKGTTSFLSDSKELFNCLDEKKVVVYDTVEDQIYGGTINDLTDRQYGNDDASFVFIQQNWVNITAIYTIK